MTAIDDQLSQAVQLARKGDLQKAMAHCHAMLQASPDHIGARRLTADLYNHLGHGHHANNQVSDAAGCFAAAVKAHPGHVEALNNLSLMLRHLGHADESVQAAERAIKLKPDEPVLYSNLALALEDEGRLDEAIAGYRKSLEMNPQQPLVHSNLLLLLNYDPEQTVQSLFDEHVSWGQVHHRPAKYAHLNDTDPDRPLRIGYVSPDYRSRPAVYFLEPILKLHNRSNFQVTGYGNIARPDNVVRRLASQCDRFHYVADWTDEKLAGHIYDEQTDILVDLAGHTSDNRLTMFALKPAPISVTFLGYQNTTGLPAIDYRVTDHVADPPGSDTPYTERLIRVGAEIVSFQPPADAPGVSPLPAKKNGFITFGSHHRLIKLNPQVIELWSRVLGELPDARLVIFPRSLSGPAMRRICDAFKHHGVDPDRLSFHHRKLTGKSYLDTFAEVDVMLDAFPTGAGATAYEALWMGVPMVALRGESFAGRIGASVLTRLGLADLIAEDWLQFVEIACMQAGRIDELAALRAHLRQRMSHSALCDAEAFVHELEAAYRRIWREWCRSAGEDRV